MDTCKVLGKIYESNYWSRDLCIYTHIYHVSLCLYVGARAKVHPNPGHIQIKRVICNNCKSMILP